MITDGVVLVLDEGFSHEGTWFFSVSAEEEAKYPCSSRPDVEAKTVSNGHVLNGYIPTIASHLELEDKVGLEQFIQLRTFCNQIPRVVGNLFCGEA